MAQIFKPYIFLALIGVILILLSFFIPTSNFVISIYDTYIGIMNVEFCKLFAIFLFSLALIYRLLDKYLFYTFISWTHIILSVLLPLVVT